MVSPDKDAWSPTAHGDFVWVIGDEVEAAAEAESGVPCFERRGSDLPIFQNWWNNEVFEYYIVRTTTTM